MPLRLLRGAFPGRYRTDRFSFWNSKVAGLPGCARQAFCACDGGVAPLPNGGNRYQTNQDRSRTLASCLTGIGF